MPCSQDRKHRKARVHSSHRSLLDLKCRKMHFCLSLTCNIPRTLELAFYSVATKEVFPFLKLSLLLPFSPYFLLLYFHFHVNLSPHFHPDHSPSVGSLHLPTFNLESNFAPRLIAQILELLRNRETGANPPHPSNKTFKIVAKNKHGGEGKGLLSFICSGRG